MKHRPDFLIISGNGRNTGKTSYACRVISKISSSFPITAIKVSPHFHPDRNSSNIILSEENFMICRENEPDGNKDSSRMLQAGARKVYYIETTDGHLEKAMTVLLENIGVEGPVICESGGMRKLVEPSLFLLLKLTGQTDMKPGFLKCSPLANSILNFDGNDFDLPPEYVEYDGSRWFIKSIET